MIKKYISIRILGRVERLEQVIVLVYISFFFNRFRPSEHIWVYSSADNRVSNTLEK
jgi:hypothetical protein